MPSPQDVARREFAVADRVLAERRELAIIAARISPPAYVKSELGERPSDPAKRKGWDRGVSQIERYRQEHGIKDPSKALGERRNEGSSKHARRPRVGGYRRFSESWAMGNTWRKRASSAGV